MRLCSSYGQVKIRNGDIVQSDGTRLHLVQLEAYRIAVGVDEERLAKQISFLGSSERLNPSHEKYCTILFQVLQHAADGVQRSRDRTYLSLHNWYCLRHSITLHFYHTFRGSHQASANASPGVYDLSVRTLGFIVRTPHASCIRPRPEQK